jgi:Skp family chaperone for outer membrane proteins
MPGNRAGLACETGKVWKKIRTQGVQNVLLKRYLLSTIRSAGLSMAALSLATSSVSSVGFAQIGSQNPQPQSTSIAVVDMEHVLDNHPSFTGQMEAMKGEFQKTMEDFEKRRKELAAEFQQLNSTLSADSPEFKQKEEAIVSRESKMRLEAVNKQKEFDERQAKLMLETYNQIVGGVAGAAQYYKYDMVVRYNRKQANQMSPKKPQTVIYGADREVIYFNPSHDLTDVVIAMLKRDIPAATPAAGAASAQTANGPAPAGTIRK